MTQPWWEQRLCAFDTETTGLNVYQDEIVEASLVFAGGGFSRETRTWLFKTERPIPEEATAVHGITNARSRAEGRLPSACLTEIANALRAHAGAIVICNAAFDVRMFATNVERVQSSYAGQTLFTDTVAIFGERIVDPIILDRRIVKKRKGKRRLVELCAHYGVKLENAHSSAADARAAGALAYAMTQAHRDFFSRGTLEDLHRSQFKWYLDQKADMRRYFERVGKKFVSDTTTWLPAEDDIPF